MSSFYNQEELRAFNFKQLGKNVMISKNACFYNSNLMSIGDDVRIDDFCVLSGNIMIGNNVHMAVFCAFFSGNAKIIIHDFCNFSSRISVYATSDDYSGNTLTNPTIPRKYKDLSEEDVIFKKHTIIGTSCVVLPGVILEEGTSVGSMSLINKSTDPWTIYAGIPAKKLKTRSKKLLDLEFIYMKEKNNL